MKFGNRVKVIIFYGKNQKDKFEINAELAEIRWDKNSFQIRGLFNPDVIKVEKENLNGKTP